MDKELLTEADIAALVRASEKLKPGQTIIGTIKSTTINKREGEPLIRKEFVAQEESRMIDFPGTPLIGNGIIGSINTDSIKKKQRKLEMKKPFSIKKGLASLAEQREIKANSRLLNTQNVKYHYDQEGRVYFLDQDDNVYYINKNRTGAVSVDGRDYYALIPEKNSFKMEFMPYEDTTYFEYYYISKAAEKKAEMQAPEELPDDFIRPGEYGVKEPSNIINLDDYKNMNGEGRHR